MISVIGIMAGFYIITRMCELIAARHAQHKFGFLGVMAILTTLVALGGMLYLLIGPDALSLPHSHRRLWVLLSSPLYG